MGFKIKISRRGVEVGPIRLPAPPEVRIAEGLAQGKPPEQIARDVVAEQRDSIASLASAPAIRVAIENLAISQMRRIVGNEVGDILEIITFPDHIMQFAPGAAVTIIKDLVRGKAPSEILGLPLATAIRQAKEYYEPKAKPIPHAVLSLLATSFTAGIVNKARYVVDDFGGNVPALINKFQESIGNQHAVCADNIIVFSSEPDPGNAFFWGHEVQHVVQYDKLGIEGFAARYTTNWKELEDEADEAGRRTETNSAVLVNWLNAIAQLHPEAA